MKRIFIFAFFLIAYSLSFCQAQFEVSQDPKHPEVKILRGLVNKYYIQNDSTFGWYNSSRDIYTPDTATIMAMANAKNKVQFVIFGGTWCEDTQFILPKFFKLQEMSGVPDEKITLFGVNRDKHSLGHIAEAFGITNVPTIIVMKDGKETGRVVEYGKTGKWDKELAGLLN
jgi:thiol-disulfide isomerase/thioredoxin